MKKASSRNSFNELAVLFSKKLIHYSLLKTERLLSLVSSIVDGFASLLLSSILLVFYLLLSSSLGLLNLLVGSILGVFNLLVSSINSSVLYLSGSIANLLQQTFDNSLRVYLGNSSNGSNSSLAIASKSLHLVCILLQEILNLNYILLGKFGVLLDQRSNLLLHSSQSFLQLSNIAILKECGQQLLYLDILHCRHQRHHTLMVLACHAVEAFDRHPLNRHTRCAGFVEQSGHRLAMQVLSKENLINRLSGINRLDHGMHTVDIFMFHNLSFTNSSIGFTTL